MLLTAVGILVSGAAFSVYQGVRTFAHGGEQTAYVWVNYLVLGLAAEHRRTVREHLRHTDDPTPRAVLTEDLAAVTGTDRVLLCARVDFVDTHSAGDLERACVRIDADLREEFPDLDEIFIQPVPLSDPELRHRVLDRYGRVLVGG